MEQHADETQDRVRRRAYKLWEQHGSREGYEAEFWHQAERELKVKRAVATPTEASARMLLRRGAVPGLMGRARNGKSAKAQAQRIRPEYPSKSLRIDW
jgi:hypothetical protein